ncbi:MAG: DUF4139 domain-containing protein [bacterium]
MSETVQTMDARIQRVTVYRNGALVERGGRASAGPVLVTGLPLLLSADSVRVRPGAGRVVDLRETCAVERQGPVGRAETAAEIERLSQALEGLDAEARALDARIEVYTDLAPAAPAGPVLPSTDQLLEMHETAGERLGALEARRVDLRDRRRTVERQLQAARAVVHADPEPPRFTRGLRFRLADVPGEVDVVVEYFVEAARWVPSYRLDLEGGQARLRLDALVAQASGEDWTGAELRLGTADLERSTALPTLDSWRIGTAGVRRGNVRFLPDDLPTLFAGYDEARARHRARDDDDADTRVQREDTTGTFRAEEETRTVVRASPLPPPGPPPPMMMPVGAAMPPPAPAMMMDEMAAMPMPQMAAASMAKRSGGMSFGGAPGGGGGEPVLDLALGGAAPPTGEGPRALRFGWLRLQGPDEPGRGTLQEVDPSPSSGPWSRITTWPSPSCSPAPWSPCALHAPACAAPHSPGHPADGRRLPPCLPGRWPARSARRWLLAPRRHPVGRRPRRGQLPRRPSRKPRYL